MLLRDLHKPKSQIGNGRSPVGFCGLHKDTLTVKQMKNKGCLSKGCWHFTKFEHTYWAQREAIKQKKRIKK